MLDRFAIETPGGGAGPADSPVHLRPEWRAPPPRAALARPGPRRRGPSPIDAGDPVDALRLMSYLWPDQPDRMAMTRGAIGMGPTRPDEGDAAPWLTARRLAVRRPGRLHVVYTTIAWQYFPAETQSGLHPVTRDRGRGCDADNPLAHVAFEADGRRDGGALTVRLWPHAPQPETLARADFHGRWVDWRG
jgi:hypothetical protein